MSALWLILAFVLGSSVGMAVMGALCSAVDAEENASVGDRARPAPARPFQVEQSPVRI